MFFNLHKLYQKMIIRGVNLRVIRVDFKGFGADRCNYNTIYRNHLDPAFNEYTQFIKRKV